MDIKSLKEAEEILTKSSNEEVILVIANELEKLAFVNSVDPQDALEKIEEFFGELFRKMVENYPEINTTALQWFVYNITADELRPIPYLKTKYNVKDEEFYKKCKSLCELNVTAEQFGADEKYTIPLRAAIVELSIIDNYNSPLEKMNCFCATFDLLFAELKTAMVCLISASDNENQFPIVNNNDIVPVLMVTIIKSKLVYMFSTLEYIKKFYYKLEESHIIFDIYKAFQTAVDEICKLNLKKMELIQGKIKPTLDLVEVIKMTGSAESIYTSSLVEQENRRILHLITTSTAEHMVYEDN